MIPFGFPRATCFGFRSARGVGVVANACTIGKASQRGFHITSR